MPQEGVPITWEGDLYRRITACVRELNDFRGIDLKSNGSSGTIQVRERFSRDELGHNKNSANSVIKAEPFPFDF